MGVYKKVLEHLLLALELADVSSHILADVEVARVSYAHHED